MEDRAMATKSLGTMLALLLGFAGNAGAQDCVPPKGFVDIQHPSIVGSDHLVSHTEQITVNHSLAEVTDRNAKTDLKNAIHKAGSLPGVAGTYSLGEIPFGTAGSHRLVCLSDGSTLEEQVLENVHTGETFLFRYIVWHYTTSQAKPIEYGIGEFNDAEISPGRTRITWTYSFKLKSNEFPGYLGSLGRYLFRVVFLDRQYAAMMRASLQGNL
jgi:hypothetical protein